MLSHLASFIGIYVHQRRERSKKNLHTPGTSMRKIAPGAKSRRMLYYHVFESRSTLSLIKKKTTTKQAFPISHP